MSPKTLEKPKKSPKTAFEKKVLEILEKANDFYCSDQWGYEVTAKGCKICQSEKRTVIEAMLRCEEIPYNDIIWFDDQSDEPLGLNKANCSTHKNKHLEKAISILVRPCNESRLIPVRLLFSLPSWKVEEKVYLSCCSLGGTCEQMTERRKKFYCEYPHPCPAKGGEKDSEKAST